MKDKIVNILIVLCLSACEAKSLKEKGVDTKALANEIKGRKIKRITDGQLMEWVKDKGSLINKKLINNPKSQDSLQDFYKTNIKHSLFQNENRLDGKEEEVFEAYKYSSENQIKLESNIQKLGEDKFLFTTPIFNEKKEAIGMTTIVFFRKEVVKMIDMKDILNK